MIIAGFVDEALVIIMLIIESLRGVPDVWFDDALFNLYQSASSKNKWILPTAAVFIMPGKYLNKPIRRFDLMARAVNDYELQTIAGFFWSNRAAQSNFYFKRSGPQWKCVAGVLRLHILAKSIPRPNTWKESRSSTLPCCIAHSPAPRSLSSAMNNWGGGNYVMTKTAPSNPSEAIVVNDV